MKLVQRIIGWVFAACILAAPLALTSCIEEEDHDHAGWHHDDDWHHDDHDHDDWHH